MRTIIELNGKKMSKKAASEKFGKEEMDRMIREAKKAFAEDPLEETSWWMGEGMLSITFRQTTQRAGKRPFFCYNKS